MARDRYSRRWWTGVLVTAAAAAVLAAAIVTGMRLLPQDSANEVAVAAAVDTEVSPALHLAVDACRNSHDPACGPFFFYGHLAPDQPMTVEATVEPATSIRAGDEVTFHLVLRDPDGVSYGGTIFDFGGSASGRSAIGSDLRAACDKYGPWDAPAPDPARAVERQDVRHTYDDPGTFDARFTFEAGPAGCVDTRSGRGEHPYSSAGSGSVTVVVLP